MALHFVLENQDYLFFLAGFFATGFLTGAAFTAVLFLVAMVIAPYDSCPSLVRWIFKDSKINSMTGKVKLFPSAAYADDFAILSR